MSNPNLKEEKKLWGRGYKIVIGLDEAGRGPLAGPVVAAAVFAGKSLDYKIFRDIRDSKELSEKKREYFYKILTKSKKIKWGIGIVSEKIIDRINILEATKLAMAKALRQARGKIKINVDFLILDGNIKLNIDLRQKSIIKADKKVFSCCAAGIIAKVTRDKIMKKYHKKYPHYGFLNHKGYGTTHHFAMIREYGPCRIHRKSFHPR